MEPIPLNEPGLIVGVTEGEQGLAELLDGVEGVHPKQVFLERADESLSSLVVRSVSGAWDAMRRASAFVWAVSAAVSGRISLIKPFALASSASTSRAVKIMSLIIAGPTSTARRV